jgi:hypothetical protein
MMWHFTAQYAPQGDIGRFTDEQIAEATGWPDEPAHLIAAMVRCGWLDEHPDHRLVVHDWHDHADYAVSRRLKKLGLDFVTRRCAQEATSERAGCDFRSHNSQPPCAHETSSERATHDHRSRLPEPEPVPEPEPEPEPEPAPAARAAPRGMNGSAGQPEWLVAIETALRTAVGRPPRPETAMRLASTAAAMGVHPRYVARWITERNGSPPKSDGLYLSIVETDLADWLRRQQCDSSYMPVEQVMCPKCGGKITAFRDLIVPCRCDADHSRAPTMRRTAEPESREEERLCNECT